MRRSDLESILRGVGLIVNEGTKGKHRTVEHPTIADIASNFDGGHGKDDEIKSNYVHAMRKLLEKYSDQLNEHLGEQK